MLLIKNGYVKTMSGEDLVGYDLLIDDNGKIAKIEKDIEARPDCEIIDAMGKLVTPGLVEAHCHVGLEGGKEGNDFNEKGNPLTPQLRAIDAICPQYDAFKKGLTGGVTTICTGPGSANAIGGTFLVMKLYGECVDDMVIKDPAGMKCAFGENVKSTYGQALGTCPVTRMGIAAVIREQLFKAKSYMEAKEAGKNPAFDMKLEAMIPVLKREIPLKAHAHRADDIFTAIRIAKEFDLKLTLDHCTDGSLIADELAEEDYPILVGPSWGSKSKIELFGKSFKTPADLYNVGLKICIVTDASVVVIEKLSFCAAIAYSEGLPEDAAWRAVTINPAEVIGVADRVGSLEVGKDADVVIWESNPITDACSGVYKTIVNGEVVYSAR